MKQNFLNLGLAGLLLAAASDAYAYDIEQDGIYYNLGSLTERVLTVTYNSSAKYSGDIVIPESVTVNDQKYTVTSIGESAFSQCSALKTVSIPNTVVSIGKQAFTMCMNLSSVNFPSSLQTIDDYAFLYCIRLTKAVLPESLTSLGIGAFSTCANLESVTVSDNLTVLPNYLFTDCGKLTSFTVPAKVKSIGQETFSNCTALASISLPEALETIDSKAFYNCTSLTSLTFPRNLNSLASDALRGCTGLMSFDVENGNSTFSAFDGLLYNADATTLFHCPAGRSSADFSESLTEISDYAFTDCVNFTSMKIPSGVTSIGDYAFNYCIGLTRVEIPESVVRIGEGAFAYCAALESLNLPATLTSISTQMLYYCTNLKTVSIPESVTFLGNYVFAMCPMLESIEMQPKKPLSCIAGFTNDVLANTILYVPEGTAELYRTTSPWSDFQNIQEKLYTGIEETGADNNAALLVSINNGVITIDSACGEITVYDIHGNIVFSGTGNCKAEPGKGIYIIKAGPLTKKVVL